MNRLGVVVYIPVLALLGREQEVGLGWACELGKTVWLRGAGPAMGFGCVGGGIACFIRDR